MPGLQPPGAVTHSGEDLQNVTMSAYTTGVTTKFTSMAPISATALGVPLFVLHPSSDLLSTEYHPLCSTIGLAMPSCEPSYWLRAHSAARMQ